MGITAGNEKRYSNIEDKAIGKVLPNETSVIGFLTDYSTGLALGSFQLVKQ